MSLVTPASQWAALTVVCGEWDGTRTSFDRTGTVLSSTPTSLYVIASVGDVSITLRRHVSLRDSSQRMVPGTDRIASGLTFDRSGSMCSGGAYLSAGSPTYLEFALNLPQSSPGGPVAARSRAVIVYNAEGHFQAVSTFRETPVVPSSASVLTSVPPFPPTPPPRDNQPKSVLVDPAAICGSWRAVSVVTLGPRGLCDECTGGDARAVSVEAGGRLVVHGTAGVVSEHGRMVTFPGGDQMIFLGGHDLWIKVPHVVERTEMFAVEFYWMARQGEGEAGGKTELLSVKREYNGGAYVSSTFVCEEKVEP
jgi:Domain of unknown function (DUF3598)